MAARQVADGRMAVRAVRPVGGEGVEAARRRVRVVREVAAVPGEALQAAREQQGWEEERRGELEGLEAAAEVRGLRAGEREARHRFLQEKGKSSRVEQKKAVRLVEDMRAAVVRRRPLGEARGRGEDKENLGPPPGPPRGARGVLGERNGGPSPFTRCEVSRHRTPSPKAGPRTCTATSTSFVPAPPTYPAPAPSTHPAPAPPTYTYTHQTSLASAPRPNLDHAPPTSLAPAPPGPHKAALRTLASRARAPEQRRQRSQEEEVREGRKRLVELLGGLGSLEATEVSGLSAVSEDGETSVDLVPVRGPTPEEDSLASSASPFPSSRMDRGERMEEGRRGSDLATVAGLVARIRQQREAMEERSNLAKPQPQALLPILPPSGAKERGQYKMNKDFIQKVLDFSRSSSLSETEVKVNVLVHPATSPSPQELPAARPRRVSYKPREKRKEGGLEQRGKEERGGREVRGKQVGQSKVDGYGKGGQGMKVEGTAPPIYIL